MLKDLGEIAIKLSRNPLGIISLAFVLVYAVAALVATKGTFEADERWYLILFLIIFPVLILIAFFLLVVKHHEKLYAPSDFANESLFVQLIEGKIERSPKSLASKSITKESRSPMEYRILHTLWTKQVNTFPDYSGVWMFRINASSPIYLRFREAASKLIGEGLISESDQGQVYLTREGFEYCKDHHKEFPPGIWGQVEPIDEQKLRIALETHP